MEEGIGEEKKSMPTVVIVLIVIGILVGLAVVGTVVFAGITFLWASSLTESDGGPVDILDAKGEIDADANTLTFEMISSTWNWNDLSVKVDGAPLTTTTGEAWAGDQIVFSSPTWDPHPGSMYEVIVTFIPENKVLWSNTIIAQ
ncbi:MAG: hypothetical protein KAH57_09220 [Thermoplasmata archaeon]|nr:hypothetical protein [Thermoplasmata archaeon]